MEMAVGKAGKWRPACRPSSRSESKEIEAKCDQRRHFYSDARSGEYDNIAKKQRVIKSSTWLPSGGPRHFPVIRLRGLPFDCCESDVLDFFWGFDVVDVLLVRNSARRLSGDAYVVFGTPIQVSYAHLKHGQTMRHRYVEVFNCGKRDYYRAIAAETRLPTDFRHTGVLKLRGLPFSATRDDIIQFFDQFKLTHDNVHLILSADGRTTGEAVVTFESCSESSAAMSKDKMTLGERYIELFPISRAEAESTLSAR